MREKYSFYEFSVINDVHGSGWYYEIYTSDPDYKFWHKTDVLIESDEWFEHEQEARLAAIGHISLLENGE